MGGGSQKASLIARKPAAAPATAAAKVKPIPKSSMFLFISALYEAR